MIGLTDVIRRWRSLLAVVFLVGVLPLLWTACRASGDPLDQFAWQKFATLVNAQSGSTGPAWNSWATPCQSGLWRLCGDQSQSPCGNGIRPERSPDSGQSLLPVDIRFATVPTQVLSDYLAAQERKNGSFVVKNFADAPELATVLFDPSVQAGIAKANLGCDGSLNKIIAGLQGVAGTARRIPANTTFATGATAVKLIWEVVPDGSDAYVYDSNLVHPLSNNALPPVNSWSSMYRLSLQNKGECPRDLPPFGPKQDLPLGCFYWKEIPTSDGFDCSQLSDFSKAYCVARKTNLIAILVGVHVMTLRDSNPNWTWMTFYWTKNTNGQRNWIAPWSHFSMMSTDAIRNDNASIPHNYVYSPYLEGANANGTHQNCLNCHTFAIYPLDEETRGLGIKYGGLEPFPAPNEVNNYFRNSVQTGLFWTIADNQDVTLSGTKTEFVNAVMPQLSIR